MSENNKEVRLLSGINISNPCISQKGNRLAYAETIDNSNIWKLSLHNPEKETMLISSSTFDNMNPDISPDNMKIVFSSNRTGTHNLWICDINGENQTRLTFFDREIYPCISRWSPDGSEILISFITESYLYNVLEGRYKKLEVLHFPEWKENGKGYYAYNLPRGNIYSYSRNGKEEKPITKNSGVVPYVYDKYIYFIKDWNYREIWRTPINGNKEEPILQGVEDIEISGWVVTKKGIYYIRENNGSPELYFYNLNTKQNHLIKKIPMAKISDTPSIDITTDESYLLYSKQQPKKSDIILIENFKY